MTTATLSHDATIADVLAISEGYVRGMYENMYEVRRADSDPLLPRSDGMTRHLGNSYGGSRSTLRVLTTTGLWHAL
jgi:hypothetical protein